MRCDKHPAYKGKSEPKTECLTCWKIYAKENSPSRLKYQIKYFQEKLRREQEKRYNEENLIEELKTVLSVARPLKAFPRKSFKGEHQEQEAVLLFSDCQIGEKIQKKETGYLDYNIEIFEERLKRLYNSVLNIINRHRKDCDINNLNIFMLGDLVEGNGNIYRGQAPRLATDVVEQVFNGQQMIADFLRSMARYFEKIVVSCIVGNHGRLRGKDEDLEYVNWDYVLYRNLQQILSRVKNIEFRVDKRWWRIEEVQGWKFYMEHGDRIKKYMTIPWYSAERVDNRVLKMLRAMNKDYDYFVFAHHHTSIEWDAGVGERICNGAFTSGNPYAMRELKVVSRPTQKMFGVHKEVGITWRYNIRLDRGE